MILSIWRKIWNILFYLHFSTIPTFFICSLFHYPNYTRENWNSLYPFTFLSFLHFLFSHFQSSQLNRPFGKCTPTPLLVAPVRVYSPRPTRYIDSFLDFSDLYEFYLDLLGETLLFQIVMWSIICWSSGFMHSLVLCLSKYLSSDHLYELLQVWSLLDLGCKWARLPVQFALSIWRFTILATFLLLIIIMYLCPLLVFVFFSFYLLLPRWKSNSFHQMVVLASEYFNSLCGKVFTSILTIILKWFHYVDSFFRFRFRALVLRL